MEIKIKLLQNLEKLETNLESILNKPNLKIETEYSDIAKFKENCLIAGEVYNEFEDVNDEDFYDCCMESICNRLEVGVGPVSDRAYEIWSIIEEEYL